VTEERENEELVRLEERGWQDALEYSALVSSLYVRRSDGWRMAFHHQTARS
jgi:hypothetical protein